MSKGVEKPSFSEFLKDLNSICEIPERINTIDLIRLKELVTQLDKMLFKMFNSIDQLLVANHNHEHPKMRDIEHWKNNLFQYGFSYNGLVDFKELIQNKINFLSVKQTNTFNDLIFKDAPSERFFNYLVEEWLMVEDNQTTALRFVFTEMWYKNIDKETPYKIKSTQTDFARDYWNKNYFNIFELNAKNPKLNNGNFTNYYDDQFKKHLYEFQGG